MDHIEAHIEACDSTIFSLPSQTSEGDRRSLLALQNAARAMPYRYIEVGSFMGGTLVPHLLDPRCEAICSIDKRPAEQPDGRGRTFDYTHSSTAAMIMRLSEAIPAANLAKLKTVDADATDISDPTMEAAFSFALIDGEHTNEAAFRDFLAVRRWMQPNSIVAFHDANIVFDGITNIVTMLRFEGASFRPVILKDAVFAILFGYLSHAPLKERELEWDSFVKGARQWLHREIAANVHQPAPADSVT
jgi:hypothetical protein